MPRGFNSVLSFADSFEQAHIMAELGDWQMGVYLKEPDASACRLIK